jgi:alpha-soluble NSF attachment protein
VADLAALNQDYYRAFKTYEKVADQSINNNLMRYSVKEYFLKAGICHLATQDLIDTERAIEKYKELDPGFASQRECQLLVDLLGAVNAKDADMFTDKLFAYNQMSKLDKWKTSILLLIKTQIQEEQEDFS